jgi:hypothetical protein
MRCATVCLWTQLPSVDYYTHKTDKLMTRTVESLEELRHLLTKFEFHAQNFKDWARQGGPINPTWARETAELSGELHRAQYRAARRIFAAEQEGARCLGSFQVYRQQKRNEAERQQRRRREGDELAPWQQQQQQQVEDEEARQRGETTPGGRRRSSSLEELVPVCNAVGRWQRLGGGTNDAAFVCDFCGGFIVWPDLRSMPSARTPIAAAGYPHWQAKGLSATTGEEKTIVFAPLAIANHVAPEPGEWQAGLICPYCEEDTYIDEGEDSSEVKYVQDDRGFPDLETFRAHLEWYHTALPVPPISALASALPSAASNCSIM